MFCQNFKSEFQKARRLLEDKAVKAAAEMITRIGARLIVIIENEGVVRFTELTAFEDDDKLVEALKVALRNAIAASAFVRNCADVESDDERLRCYVQALSMLQIDQYRDEVGLFAARTLKEYLALVKGWKEKIGVVKIIIEGILLSAKK